LIRGFDNRNPIKNNQIGIVRNYDISKNELEIDVFRNGKISKLNLDGNSSLLTVHPEHVVVAEAVTLYKIQGQTLQNAIINLNQIRKFKNGLLVAMSRVCSSDNIFFVDEENRSRSFFIPSKSGGAGSETIKEREQKSERKNEDRCKNGNPKEIKNYVYIKKYGSNTTPIIPCSKIFLNEYYIGKNNGFIKEKRNALLQQLGLIERINYHQADEFGLYTKTEYDYKILKPFPYFSYTSNYEKRSLYTKVYSPEDSIFESLNPMKPEASPKTHKDEDCYSTTRFLFEIDVDDKGNKLKDLPRREREKWKAYYKAAAIKLGMEVNGKLNPKGIINRIVSSGNVSYHCIVETSYKVPDYKCFWDHLNVKYFEGRADRECSNPSRWTRTPGVRNPDTEKIQRSYLNVNRVFDPTDELKEMKLAQEEMRKTNEEERKMEKMPVIRNRNDAFAHEVKRVRNKKDNVNVKFSMKPEAQELLLTLPTTIGSDEFIKQAIEVINDLHNRGCSIDFIWDNLKLLGKDKKGRYWRDKVKRIVFNNRPYYK